MKSLLIISCFILSTSVFSQNLSGLEYHLFPEKQSECEVMGMAFENSRLTIEYTSINDLFNDLFSDVPKDYLQELNGEIMIQVLIDESFKPCCISFSNESGVSSEKLELVKHINKTNKWKFVDWKLSPRKTCIILKIIFGADTVKIERLGIDRDSEFSVIISETIKR